jgi:hypothetical protein
MVELSTHIPDQQRVAHVFASHMLQARSDKETASLFSHDKTREKRPRREARRLASLYLKEQRKDDSVYTSPLSELDKKIISTQREVFADADKEHLDGKKDQFTGSHRLRLIFQAKSPFINGMNKEERIAMYEDAGYTEEEISNVAGKKMAISAGIGAGIFGSGLLMKGDGAAEGNLPLIDQIPNGDLKWVAAAGVVTYLSSLATAVNRNHKLTQEIGTSAFPGLTALYYYGDKLLSNRTRDRVAKGASMGFDIGVQGSAIGASLAASGDLQKTVAVGAISTILNGVIAGGSEAWLRISRRKRKATE